MKKFDDQQNNLGMYRSEIEMDSDGHIKNLERDINEIIEADIEREERMQKVACDQNNETRKYGYCAPTFHKNYILIFGNQPLKKIDKESEMVADIIHAFENNFNHDYLTLTLPKVLKDVTIHDKDEYLELVSSNTVQPLNLIYQHNIV